MDLHWQKLFQTKSHQNIQYYPKRKRKNSDQNPYCLCHNFRMHSDICPYHLCFEKAFTHATI